MSYMTSNNLTDLGEFLTELENAFSYAPSSMEYKMEIKVTTFQGPLGTIRKDGVDIVFVPAGADFETYSVPDKTMPDGA